MAFLVGFGCGIAATVLAYLAGQFSLGPRHIPPPPRDLGPPPK